MGKLWKIGLGAGLTVGCFAALPASAQVHSFGNSMASGPVSAKSAHRNPNRQVCVTEQELGTRLATRRHCMTAAEWVAYRREIRDTVDRIQAMKPSQQ